MNRLAIGIVILALAGCGTRIGGGSTAVGRSAPSALDEAWDVCSQWFGRSDFNVLVDGARWDRDLGISRSDEVQNFEVACQDVAWSTESLIRCQRCAQAVIDAVY